MNEFVFRRIEQKYLLTKKQYHSLLSSIKDYIKPDPYFENTICSIYFDNENHDLIHRSLEKPIFKEKVRLRSYGIPSMNSKVYLEMKDKYQGVVGKRRVEFPLKEYYQFLEEKKIPTDQIKKELKYCFEKFLLKPFVFVGYDRKSYLGKEETNLRITFDSNLRYRFSDLKLEKGDYGEAFFDTDNYIMEIKALDAMPLWLAKSLSSLKIYPTSFSKVGSIYEKYKRSGVTC